MFDKLEEAIVRCVELDEEIKAKEKELKDLKDFISSELAIKQTIGFNGSTVSKHERSVIVDSDMLKQVLRSKGYTYALKEVVDTKELKRIIQSDPSIEKFVTYKSTPYIQIRNNNDD